MRKGIVLLSALIAYGCSGDEISIALEQIDETIATGNPEEKYHLADSLYEAYKKYDLDSACSYLEKKCVSRNRAGIVT